MKEITKVRGTVDKLEADFAVESQIIHKISSALADCNFGQIETPILEKESLFVEAIGSDTDVVNKELFYIQSRSEKDEATCLRPELTAGVFRAYLNNRGSITTPWKVFSVGSCFRYERPQKGRTRQFDQISVEMIDAKSQMYDAELLVILDRLFSHTFELTNYILKINYIGTAEDRERYRGVLLAYLQGCRDNLCQDCARRMYTNILRCLDCKVLGCIGVVERAPKLADFLSVESVANFNLIQRNLEHNSINFEVDQLLVRGLDYYQGLVFEFVSASEELGSQSTFCGGGRYELASRFGCKSLVPSVGAGIGMVRLAMIVDRKPEQKAYSAIIPLSTDEESAALMLADYLRKNERRCDVVFDKSSVGAKIKLAVSQGAKFAIFIGATEVAGNFYTVKNLTSGDESKVSQQDILSEI